ncbi:MAG: orotidine-5'-phosphate decarboxylase [Spirochaetaceae bacterium]|jgi:orotidine-5'-phosphate decarboxylase|nr:orotidine-5'-phosphate decarboxylase [Spirochaetaceae bacterium]
MNTHAMDRLRRAAQKNGPLCVGLDTSPSHLPPALADKFPSPAQAVGAYNRAILERLGDSAACCKVQIACYEALGLEGLSVYAETLRAVREAGLTVIADVKRGDIADTGAAYARAHFSGDFEADLITVNPYMGFDTLAPFTEYARPPHGKGFFVLLRTSNPGMADIEQQPLASGGLVLDRVGAELQRLAGEFAPAYPGAGCSPVGAVVGCTEEADARLLRDAYRDIFFLIPGYGAQGGAARVAATLLDNAGGVVNSSRAVLTAWKTAPALAGKAPDMDDIADEAARAAQKTKESLLEALRALDAQGSAPG